MFVKSYRRLLAILFSLTLSACSISQENVQAKAEPAATPQPAPTNAYIPYTQPTSLPEASAGGCEESSGEIRFSLILDRHQGGSTQVNIYLPPCYDPQPSRPYPLLILLHGLYSDQDQWIRMGIAEKADEMIRSGEIPPVIIAMPKEVNTLLEPVESEYEASLIESVLPWLEQTFPVSHLKACRAIGGLSRGAYWAYKTGTDHWQTFGAIGGHSMPNRQFTEYGLRDLVKVVPEGQFPRLYLDSGRNDVALEDAIYLEGLFSRYRLPHTWQLFDGEHSEAYWSAHISDYLRWYSQPWLTECGK